MSKRKRVSVSYKTRWEIAKQDTMVWRSRAEAVSNELERVRAVLAAEGAKIAERLPKDGDEPIYLPSLGFECVTALIRSNARYADDRWDAWDVALPTSYSWRGRALLRMES